MFKLPYLILSPGDEFGVHTRDRNGTIFSCVPDDDHHAQFVSYILTTADLFIAPKISNPQCENEKRGVSPLSKVCSFFFLKYSIRF
jgi:hypothetical protein